MHSTVNVVDVNVLDSVPKKQRRPLHRIFLIIYTNNMCSRLFCLLIKLYNVQTRTYSQGQHGYFFQFLTRGPREFFVFVKREEKNRKALVYTTVIRRCQRTRDIRNIVCDEHTYSTRDATIVLFTRMLLSEPLV